MSNTKPPQPDPIPQPRECNIPDEQYYVTPTTYTGSFTEDPRYENVMYSPAPKKTEFTPAEIYLDVVKSIPVFNFTQKLDKSTYTFNFVKSGPSPVKVLVKVGSTDNFFSAPFGFGGMKPYTHNNGLITPIHGRCNLSIAVTKNDHFYNLVYQIISDLIDYIASSDKCDHILALAEGNREEFKKRFASKNNGGFISYIMKKSNDAKYMSFRLDVNYKSFFKHPKNQKEGSQIFHFIPTLLSDLDSDTKSVPFDDYESFVKSRTSAIRGVAYLIINGINIEFKGANLQNVKLDVSPAHLEIGRESMIHNINCVSIPTHIETPQNTMQQIKQHENTVEYDAALKASVGLRDIECFSKTEEKAVLHTDNNGDDNTQPLSDNTVDELKLPEPVLRKRKNPSETDENDETGVEEGHYNTLLENKAPPAPPSPPSLASS